MSYTRSVPSARNWWGSFISFVAAIYIAGDNSKLERDSIRGKKQSSDVPVL